MLKIKISPKKGDLKDVIYRHTLAFEFKMNNFIQDSKNYAEQLKEFFQSIEKIEKASQNQIAFKSPDLYKEFLDVQTKMLKSNKEIEATQTRSLKMEGDFAKKLLVPLANGDFNHLTQAEMDTAKTNIQKIETTLAIYKKELNEIIDNSQQHSKRLASLESIVKTICLPEQIDELSKISLKLTERMESICQSTASLCISEKIQQFDPKKVTNTVLQLFDAQTKRGQFLNQIRQNIEKLDTSAKPDAELNKSQVNLSFNQ